MEKVRYQEQLARSALNRVRGMPFRWSLNPYQGCPHGCHYCFARRYSYFRDLNPGDDFSSIVMVKINAPEVLAAELSRPSWKRETVAMGTATGPYQPIEGKYRLTRRCLEVFCRKANPMSLVTKGTMAVRDLDLFAELSRKAGCTVCFSITTLNEDIWRRLEPGTPPPVKRLQAVEKLSAAGINAGVLLAPIIPGITDDVSNLREVIKGASQHGARFLGANTLYLKEGTKEHFLGFLEREYPRLVGAYREFYPGAFSPRRMKDRIQEQVADLREEYGLAEGVREPDLLIQPEQLRLALQA